MSTRPVIELADVTAGYHRGSPVLRAFSQTLEGPGLVLLRGANGVGKSTLLEVCSGYLRPDSGEVLVSGLPATAAATRASRRVVRSSIGLLPEMAARDHLVLAARSSGSPLEPLLERAVAYGLGPWLEVRAGALSNGNRRKLWLLMCTPAPAPVVLLDEPFQGLDAEGVDLLVAEVRRWSREGLVLLVSHEQPPGLVPDRELVLEHPGRAA